MSGLKALRGGQDGRSAGFEVAYADVVEGEVRRPLADVAMVAFEQVSPVRTFPSYKGQRNYPGFYWAACSGRHVGFESWLERDEAMPLDFDANVIGFAAQPFWLFWPDTSRIRSHAPDFFARTMTGGGVVIDCRPAARIKPRDAAAFEATARAYTGDLRRFLSWSTNCGLLAATELADDERLADGMRHLAPGAANWPPSTSPT